MRMVRQIDLSRRRSPGFTLIELMVVVAIIGIMAFLLGNSFSSVSRSTDMTNSVQQVADTLNVARQIAVSRNEYTQVRFYGLATNDSDPTAGQYSVISLYRADAPYYTNDYSALLTAGKMVQVGKVTKLPNTCLIVKDPTYSPIFQDLTNSLQQLPALTMPDGKQYNGVAFYFKPDGSLDVPPKIGTSTNDSVNALSICGTQAFLKAGNKIPANYGIINIERANGRFLVIRP